MSVFGVHPVRLCSRLHSPATAGVSVPPLGCSAAQIAFVAARPPNSAACQCRYVLVDAVEQTVVDAERFEMLHSVGKVVAAGAAAALRMRQ